MTEKRMLLLHTITEVKESEGRSSESSDSQGWVDLGRGYQWEIKEHPPGIGERISNSTLL